MPGVSILLLKICFPDQEKYVSIVLTFTTSVSTLAIISFSRIKILTIVVNGSLGFSLHRSKTSSNRMKYSVTLIDLERNTKRKSVEYAVLRLVLSVTPVTGYKI